MTKADTDNGDLGRYRRRTALDQQRNAARSPATIRLRSQERLKRTDKKLRDKIRRNLTQALRGLDEVHDRLYDVDRRIVAEPVARLQDEFETMRRRARQRLTDIAREERVGHARDDGDPTAENAIEYLGQSLAEHLATAATESPEACHQRAQEIHDFVANTPVDDEAYIEIRDELEGLVEQLAVTPSDGTLDKDRIERVERIAKQVKRLYQRGS